MTLEEIGASTQNNNNTALEATVSHTSEISPPPYMVGAAEIELDTETGEISVIDYAACVDCGTPINPNLTRVQAEGGLLQGIGMALTENVTYDEKGVLAENSFLQYKIPARVDVGRIRVDFDCSYEDAGPFGAKSIGEVVINTPLPAIADAVYNATGKRFSSWADHARNGRDGVICLPLCRIDRMKRRCLCNVRDLNGQCAQKQSVVIVRYS